jgi:hypothetical protein
MPTANEIVGNKALGGEELRSILRADFERLMDADGLLSHYMAYNRISYDITLRLHLDNPYMPESKVVIESKPKHDTVIESAPLKDASAAAVASGTNIHRDVTSPNAERLRHGLPLPVTVRGQDGTTQTQQVKYPPQPDLGPGEVAITDETKATREAWKVPTE